MGSTTPADSAGRRVDGPGWPHHEREIDIAGLKALAHPLRVQLFDALSIYGSDTASGLAERLGESSGATSYHLRQLEKHGFVREVEGKGTSRERWWERTPGSVNIGSDEAIATPAGRSAATMIFRQLRYNDDRLLTDFVERGVDELPREWVDASVITTMNTRLTPEQLVEFVREVTQLADKYVVANKQQHVPNSRPIHVGFQAFPVLDGDVVPADRTPEEP
ncbi:MAG: helix-turn-helix domain-containing protein [Galbitalea sp.]